MGQIADMLIDVRKKAGLSQKRLASKMGCSHNYICKIESGKVMPTFQTVDKFFKTCGFRLVISAN